MVLVFGKIMETTLVLQKLTIFMQKNGIVI